MNAKVHLYIIALQLSYRLSLAHWYEPAVPCCHSHQCSAMCQCPAKRPLPRCKPKIPHCSVHRFTQTPVLAQADPLCTRPLLT